MDKPFEIKLEDKPDEMTLKFSGNLVINYIGDITKTVKELVDISKPLCVEISNPDSIDLTFIQLVISLQKTYINNDLRFTVSAGMKDDFKVMLANAGLKNIVSN